ncbi:MAG: hypothetical protein ACREM2_02110, partial [Vulcanimicrobiaceae bacterium]
RKRDAAPRSAAALAEPEFASEAGEEAYAAGELDPLDAQNAGLHDAELALGHEEIRLNLEADDENEAPDPHAAQRE